MPLHGKEIRFSQSGRTPSGFFRLVLRADQLQILEKIGKKKTSEEGKQLISVGMILDSVYILDGGTAEVLAPNDGDQLQTVRSVAPGEVLGLTETLAVAASDFSVSCVTDCVFTEIPRDELIRYLRKAPDTCFELVSMMATAFIDCLHAVSR